MATKPRRVCALDIDSRAVKRLVLEADAEGFAIRQVDFADVPHAEEGGGTWTERIGESVGRLLSKESEGHGGQSGDVHASLDLQQITTRYFVLPRTSAENVRRAVETEVEVEIPLPIDQIIWDYQVMDGKESDPERHDIFVAGVRRDLVESLIGELKKRGLSPQSVAVSSLAAFYGYQMSPGAKQAGTVALLDIGGSRTAITIGDAGTVFYTRSIAITAPQTEEGEGKSRGAGAFIEGISLEIQRTMTYLRASHRRSPEIRRVLITGGCARLPGLAEGISQRLGTPVEVYDPLSPLTLTSGKELLEGSGDRLAVCVGTALAALKGGEETINLMPEAEAEAAAAARPASWRESKWLSPALSAVLLLVLGILLYARPVMQVHAIQSELSTEESVVDEIEYLNQRKTSLEAIYKEHVRWTNVLKELADVIPRDIVLTELNMKDAKYLSVNLKLGSPSQAPEIVRKFEESPLFESARHGNINVAEQGCTVTVMAAMTAYRAGEAPKPVEKKEEEKGRSERRRPSDSEPPPTEESGPSDSEAETPPPTVSPSLELTPINNAGETPSAPTAGGPGPGPGISMPGNMEERAAMSIGSATSGVRTFTRPDGTTVTFDPANMRRMGRRSESSGESSGRRSRGSDESSGRRNRD